MRFSTIDKKIDPETGKQTVTFNSDHLLNYNSSSYDRLEVTPVNKSSPLASKVILYFGEQFIEIPIGGTVEEIVRKYIDLCHDQNCDG